MQVNNLRFACLIDWFQQYGPYLLFVSVFVDAIHAAIQPARQAEASKVVRGASRQDEKEDHERADYDHLGKEA